MKKQEIDIFKYPVSKTEKGTIDKKIENAKKVKVFPLQISDNNRKPKTVVSLAILPNNVIFNNIRYA